MKNIIITLSVLSAFVFNIPSNQILDDSKSVIRPDSTITITISVVGDLMCHSPQFEYAKVGKDSFDFTPTYRNVKKYLESSDFTFGNLETVTAGRKNGGFTGYPFFNTPSEYLDALKSVGFDLLVTANNHSIDRSEKGVLLTIDELVKRDINYVGTYNSKTDRDSIRLYDIKGIKIAVLAYSYGTNGNVIPKGKDYLINLIDFNLIEHDIKTARSKGAELVLVHYHFGDEYIREPVKSQKDAVNKAIEFGADIIIGGHPHVLQPADFFKTVSGKLDTGFVAYSMGNFISNQRERFKDAGIIITINILKDLNKDKISINEVNFLPTWVFKGNTLNGKEYVILPATLQSDTTIDLSLTDLKKMNQAFQDTREIIRKYSANPKLKEIKEID
ncbi:MAG: CapA family protein [Ignavibacteriota bacterium]|nr:CapA family protein [Ignavibacteriota bacterium]MCO6447790.1 CapA family protein [Ignavibacterium album]MCZ2267783.1 CapA family protein [Ignavibacteriales bacterium]QKJ99174.1 MAG: CapA family protein [Ignavibacteriota bacterium]